MIHEIYYERDELFDVNMIITFRIDITGRPTYDKVEQAFYKAIGINEILLTKVNIEADGRAFYSDNDESGSWIRLVDEDLENIRQREEKKRFLIEKGEYLRVFVRENSGDTSILFMMHHLAGDGKSLLYFIEDFMTFLSGGTKEYKKIRTVEIKENIDAISQGIVRYYNKKWSGKAFDFDDLDQAYQSYWSNKSSEIETRIIEEKELKDILNNCREARIKFTAYLTAILISEEKNEMCIGYAVDYRHDNNRSMGNQASGISIKYKYVPSKSLTENARRIQNKLDKKLKEHEKGSYVLSFVGGIKPTLRDAVNLEHAGYFHNKVSYRLAKLMGYVGKTKDYSITNLMVADIPVKYGEYEIKNMMFVAPVVSYGKRIISVVTCNGRTVITRHEMREC